MSEDTSSSLPAPATQPNEPIQTTNTPTDNHQDIKNDDPTTTSNDHERSSSPIVQNAHDESNQTATLNANKNENSSTPELEATTTDSTKTTSNAILDSSSNPVATLPRSTTNPILDSSSNPVVTLPAANNHENPPTIEAQSTTITQTSTTHDHVTTSPDNVQTTTTTQIIDSDPNKHATEISTNESSNVTPPEVQPTTVLETSTNETPNSDLNSTSIRTEIQPIPPVPEIQSVDNVEPSTSQIPDSGANKQATAIPTHDSTNTSITKDASANQDSNLVDQANTSKANNGTKEATNKKTNKDASPSETTFEQERKYLVNLIGQELKFVEKICPKLGKHQEHITKEAKDASELYEKLDKRKCDMKELKRIKKIVTKLKLQIPAKYRTYDDSDQQKNKQSNGEKRGNIPAKLLKNMPQLHNKLFQESPFCKAVQRRYHDLGYKEFGRELKLCLLCFSIFPENELISRRLMVYWWIAEGLTPREDDFEFGKTAEDYANGFFEKLMEMDFIEPATSKSPNRYVAICKMHPMVRAALVMIADQVKFLDFDEYGNPKDFGKFDEIESPEDLPNVYPLGDPREFFDFFNEQRQPTSEAVDLDGNPVQFAALPPNKVIQDKDIPVVDRNGKTIDTNNKYYYYQKKVITTRSYKVCLMGSGLSKGITWEKLHMVFNVNDDILELKPEWFLRMKNVNVVFLGRWQSSAAHHIEVEEFKFEESLVNLNHVRFFSLQGVSRVSELPNSISKLGSLSILDLRACHNLEVIPNTIGSLKYLTHLDMSECYLLKDIPKEISSLESLQVLKGFVVVDSPGGHVCTLQDLEKLENLRKLSMYTHMKDFPQEPHLDALQKFVMLRKLTILWGGHESKPQNDKSKQTIEKKNKNKISSRIMKLIPEKKWVEGSMRRMNAFNNSTLGSRLEKLDLKCFPHNVTPNWLTPGSLKGLKKLYIRGGQFSDLGQYQDTLEWDDSAIPPIERWNKVEVLRLKYLDELKMEWRELQDLFPKMTSLEKVKCPWLTLFPCNERGVWIKKTTT